MCPAGPPANWRRPVKRLPDLTSDVRLVAAGETVVVTDYKGEKHTVKIPDDAKKGQRFWFEIKKQWIDFTVDELVSVDFTMVDNDVEFTFKAKRSDVKELTATFEGQSKTFTPSSSCVEAISISRSRARSGIW